VNLNQLTIHELRARMLAGEAGPVAACEAGLAAIDEAEPRVGAFLDVHRDAALARASALEASGGFRALPLGGVPVAIKDNICIAGARTTCASRILGDYVPPYTATVVEKLEAAGAVVIGKTNLDEFAMGSSTENSAVKPTRNPWDTGRTAGGSSGGAAAAVAAGMVPMAHGNDAGGSIRVPAACCSVFGLKPTRARIPLGPHYGDLMSGLVAEHALTRSVRDSAALLDAVSGPELGDPYWAPPPARPFAAEIGAPPGKLRIAYSTRTITGAEISPQCVAAVEDAARLCAHLGHEVVEAMPKIDAERFFLAFTSVLSAGFTWAIDDWTRRLGRTPTEDLFEPFVWAFTGRGRQFTAPQYLLAVQDLQRISRTVAHFFAVHDVWLTPMLGEPPVPLGTFAYQAGTDPFELRRKMARFTPFSYFANATGQPAMAVPTYWTPEGLPVGNQYIGRFGDEATLFRLASQIEAERPWARRHPPVWAG